MLATDSRFVIWSKCRCGSAFNVFRGHRDIIAVLNCELKGFNAVCDMALFDRRHNNRVCAFLFKASSFVPPGLEGVGGWPCPVFQLSDDDFACIKAHPQSRFASLLERPCARCIAHTLYCHKTRTARAAFHRWKSNCPFLYN